MQEILVNTILGGITGYITNNLAIKMLFKEYLGFGGVIEKEYKSFIDNISSLIEKDLINHDTLSSEISSKEFQNTMQEVIKTIFLFELPKNSGQKRLSEIAGYEATQQNICNYIDEVQLLKEGFKIIKNEKINNIVSKPQYDYMANKFSQIIIKHQAVLNDILYDHIAYKNFEDLVSHNIFFKLKQNLANFIDDIDFKEFDGDINKYFNEILNIIDIDSVITNLEQNISEMYLSDFINDTDNLSRELIKRTLEVIQSDEGREILENLISNIIKIAKNIDVSLFEILDDSIKTNIVVFIETKLPDILNDILFFIDHNSKEIERRINHTIDNVLESSWSGKILKLIKDIFISDLTQRYKVVDQIKEVISEYGENAGKELANQLLDILHNKTIGEIIQILDDKNILNTSKLAYLAQKNISSLKTKKIESLDELLDKKIKDIIEVDLSNLKTEIIPMAFDIVKEKFIYDDKFKLLLKREITSLIENLKHKPIEEYIQKFDFDFNVNLSEYYDKLDANIDFDINIEYKDKLSKIGEVKLNYFYEKLQSKQENITDITIKAIESNLKTLLSGNVSLAVSRELSKFNPSEIRDMVEGFMGKELKPINTLGTILGGIAGAGYYMATLPFANPYLHYATPFIYGATGIFTNHLAINMLFRPYEKKFYLPYFSPGVVAKQKPKFAKNISNFVKGDILTDEALKAMFENNKESWEQFLKDFISKDNYILLDKILKDNVETISVFSYMMFVDFIISNNETISETLIEYLENNKNLLNSKSSKIANFLLDLIYQLDFSEFVIEKLKEYQLSEFIPVILEFISKNDHILIEKIEENLEFNKVRRYILNFENEYKNFISENDLYTFIDKTTRKSISSDITDKIIIAIKDRALIDMIIDKFQEQNLNPNKRLKELFDGGIESFFYDNIDYLIEEMISSVQIYKEDIRKKLINSLPFGTGWALESKVNDIVDEVFDNTIVEFIYDKKSEIIRIFTKILDYKLADIGIENSLNKDKLREILNTIYQSNAFYHGVDKLVDSTFDIILQMKLDIVLRLLNIKNLRQLIDIVSVVLENGLIDIQNNIHTNEKQLISATTQLLETILFDISRNKNILYLLEGDLENEINYIVKKLQIDDKFKKDILLFLEDLIVEFINSEFYDRTILKEDLSKFIIKLAKIEHFKDILMPIIKNFFMNLNQNLDIELKDELRDYFIEAIFNSIEINLNEIVNSINIQEVIEREINQMHPKEIEEMFYSFAGSYFRKLKMYGAFGAVFGIPSVFM